MIKYKRGFKYQMYEEVRRFIPWLAHMTFETPFIICVKGHCIIKKGYAWDGPSGPAIHTKSFMRGSLWHDVLYQLMRQEIISRHYRKEADELLVEICLEDGMWKIRAMWVLWGVDKFAKGAAHPDHIRRILTAP